MMEIKENLARAYGWFKKNKLRALAMAGCIVGLGMVMNAMGIFETKPPENLVRLYEINAALKEDVQLNNLLYQPNRDSLINYVKGLETERDSLDSLLTFTSERMNYEDAKRQEHIKETILMGAGILLGLGSTFAYLIKELG